MSDTEQAAHHCYGCCLFVKTSSLLPYVKWGNPILDCSYNERWMDSHLLMQVGCFVPAASARLHVIDGIWTRMGANDSLSRGRSTFLEELSETSDILAGAGPRSLVILVCTRTIIPSATSQPPHCYLCIRRVIGRLAGM